MPSYGRVRNPAYSAGGAMPTRSRIVGAMSVTCTQSCDTRPPSFQRAGHCITMGTRMPPFIVVVLYIRYGAPDTSVQPSGYVGHDDEPPSSPAAKKRRTHAG